MINLIAEIGSYFVSCLIGVLLAEWWHRKRKGQ